MNKIFKNKIFYILIFSALFILALNCNSFAFTYDSIDYPDLAPVDGFDYSLYIDCRDDTPNPYIFGYLTTSKVYVDSSSNILSVKGKVRRYTFKNNSWVFDNDFGSNDRVTELGFPLNERDVFMFSNYVVLDSNGKTVFQVAPQAQVEPLAEITQVEEIQPVVAKIVGLVLPACLTIFGTLLVLFLIKSKNLLQL